MTQKIQLKGRVFIRFDILAETGMHIGGSNSGIEIGGVDKTVIRNPLTNQPYIPGSSLKGKLRSLLEKYKGLPQNKKIGQGFIHSCDDKDKPDEYAACDVCQVFGVSGEAGFSTPTRLMVRDTHMDPKSAGELERSGRTDLPYTEVKTEVAIDRVTSAASPRTMERVPAGTNFKDAELVFNIFDGGGCDAKMDIERLKVVATGLQLLEDDYLGGLGSRGSGRVKFHSFRVEVRGGDDYLAAPKTIGSYDNLPELINGLAALQEEVRAAVA